MAGSATILGCAGPVLTAWERGFFAEIDPLGFILFARNVDAPDQLRRLTGDLRDVVSREAPILIDQEGGRVQRMRAPHWREWLPALDFVARAGPDRAPRAMWIRSRLIAAELRAVGIDTNCTPLADVARPNTHPVLKNRLYGTEPGPVADLARAVAEGQMAGGVLPVVKHLPGYGLGGVDSHTTLPRVAAPRSELDQVDFAAFRPLADLPMGMTAHIVYDAIETSAPATLSPALIDLIRDDIGFQGLLMTDDLSMGALPGAIGARAAAARAAGCDIVLHCNGTPKEMVAVVANAGPLDGQSAARAAAALAQRQAPQPLDIRALEDELGALLS